MPTQTDVLFFLDLETTGIKPIVMNRILEIAILPVDQNLQPLDAGWTALVHPSGFELDSLGDVVKKMHTENGLLEDLKTKEPLGLQEATRRAVLYCEKFGNRGQVPLAGSSIRFDRGYLDRYMPGLENWFHYRIVDVSSLKELWKRWFPEIGQPPKEDKAHRALDDCYASVAELQWYKGAATCTGKWMSNIKLRFGEIRTLVIQTPNIAGWFA